jgi:phosphoribosylanthranilate isomerase
MRVKVCGITLEEQLVKLPETGATFAGLIFYPKSPRYVLRQMTTNQIKKESNVNKVGVFVNASVEEVLHMVMNAGYTWYNCMVMKPQVL